MEVVTILEVPRLRTRPPVEADGFFLRRNLSPQRTIWRSGARLGITGLAVRGSTWGNWSS